LDPRSLQSLLQELDAAAAQADPATQALIKRLVELTPVVRSALSSPEELAFGVGELELARQMLVPDLEPGADGFITAAIELARSKGYDTIFLDFNPSGPPYVVLTRASGNPAPPVDAGRTGAVKDRDFM